MKCFEGLPQHLVSRLCLLNSLAFHGSMFQAFTEAWISSHFHHSVNLYIHIKYIVAMLAMTEKNIFPSTFRREMDLKWVTAGELSSCVMSVLFDFHDSLHIHF